MADFPYFTAERTALTIPDRGCVAIYCGDAPTRHDDGTTSYKLRAPLLIIPNGMFDDEDGIAAKVAAILNRHAGEFFDSAKGGEDA